MKVSLSLIIVISLSIIFISCSKSPEIIYVNGKIYTLDANNKIVEAIAVKDGKIFDLGNSNEIKDKYQNADEIDLEGRTVIPGFIDSEGSLIDFSRNLSFIDLSRAKSVNEIKKLLSERINNMPSDSWIGGFGWNELLLPEDDLMNMDKSVLDEVAPDINVYLVNISSNTVWCNSKILKTLQITKFTPSPEFGEIEKNDKGELTGLLYDSAINLVKEKIPVLSEEDMKNVVEKGANELLRYGITGIRDKTVTLESIKIFKELIDNNRLNNRIYAIISAGDDAFEYYIKNGTEINYSDKLTVRSVSIDYDGSIDLHAAYMNDNYTVSPDTSSPYTTIETVENYFRTSYDNGFQFCIKAVGDKAVNLNLRAIESVIKEKGTKDHRTIFEYVQFIRPDDISTFNNLKIIPSIRPEIDINALVNAGTMLPPSAIRNLAKWNDILKSTNIITSGSNFPFNTISPIIQIYYLASRQSINSDSILAGDDQKLSILDAVKSFTIWSAYSGFEEEVKGTIEISKYADFIVLSENIFEYDPNKLYEIKVLKTVLGGKILYDASTKNKL